MFMCMCIENVLNKIKGKMITQEEQIRANMHRLNIWRKKEKRLDVSDSSPSSKESIRGMRKKISKERAGRQT